MCCPCQGPRVRWSEKKWCETFDIIATFVSQDTFFTNRARKADLPKQHMHNTWQKTMQVGFSEKRKKVHRSSHVSFCHVSITKMLQTSKEKPKTVTPKIVEILKLYSQIYRPPGPTITPPIQTFSAFAQSLSLSSIWLLSVCLSVSLCPKFWRGTHAHGGYGQELNCTHSPLFLPLALSLWSVSG